MKRFFTILFSGLLSVSTFAQQGSVDNTFNSIDKSISAGANGEILSSIVQPDGKILIVGSFTSYNGVTANRIARINQDGSVDNTFILGTGANGTIYSLALQSNGYIIIVGDFTSYNGTSRTRIARLSTSGSLDLTFNPGSGANRIIYSVAVQFDGKILIGGNFTRYNGTTYNRILRLSSTGAVDATFAIGNGANGIVNAVKVQSDGKILIVGEFTSYRGTTRNRIARINTTGTIDSGFSPSSGANNTINSIAIQSDGKYLITGNFTTFNGTSRNRIARVNTTGTLDTGFNPGTGANNTVKAVLVLSDGKVLVGGSFTTINGSSRVRIACLNTNGSLYTTFNPTGGANSTVNSINQYNNRIIITGLFTQYNGINRNYISLSDLNGSIDLKFNTSTGANAIINSSTIQKDGKIIIAGDFTAYNDTVRTRIARLNSNGSVDVTFNSASGASAAINSIAIQADGKIIIAGDFTTYAGVSRNRIARLNSDGSLDNTFLPGTGANGSIYAVAIQPDGKILIGGAFTTYNGTTRNRIARLTSTGSYDATFAIGTGFNTTVNTIALQPDGKILVGGAFTSYSGTTRNRVARLNADGTIDSGFSIGTGFNNTVNALVVQTNGSIIAGGNFTTYNGTARNRIVRLLSTGTIDNAFAVGTGANSSVTAIMVQPDDNVLIAGDFTTINGSSSNRLARLLSTGSLDNDFVVGSGANVTVKSLLLQVDNKVVIFGNFTQYNGVVKNRLARLHNCFNTDSTITITACNSYTLNNITYIETGNYVQTLTNKNGCDSTIYLNLTISKVVATASVNAPVCEGDTLKLFSDLVLGHTYLWRGPNGFNAIVNNSLLPEVNQANNGFYSVKVTNADGCIDSAEVEVNVGKHPVVSIKSNSPVCEGSSLVLLADGGNSYLWSGPGNFTSKDKNSIIGSSTASLSGYYKVEVSDNIGCSTVDSIEVQINPNLDTNIDDNLFNQPTGSNHWILSSAVQSDNKILLGGYFTAFNGVSQNRIVRLNQDGTIDESFNICTGANESVNTIAGHVDNKILIGGYFNSYANNSINRIARLNSDGSLDLSFNVGEGANGRVRVIKVQNDSKILVAGSFSAFDGKSFSRIVRLNIDGSVDSTFKVGAGANSHVFDMALQPDGKIVLVGSFTTFNGNTYNRIVRLNTDGSIDTSFNPLLGADNAVRTVSLTQNGKVFIGGNFLNYNGVSCSRVALLNTDGSLDTSFSIGSGLNDAVYASLIQSNGKILIGGYFTAYNGVENINRLACLNIDGSLDNTFDIGSGFNAATMSISATTDGDIIVGGSFTLYNNVAKRFFIQLNNVGNVRNDLLPLNTLGANSTIYALAVQSNSNILAGGTFTTYNGVPVGKIVSILPDGKLNTAFNAGTGADNIVRDIKVLSNGKIALGGYFTSYDETLANRIVVLNTDGTPDLSSNFGNGFNSAVFSIQEQVDSKLIVSGAFTNYNGNAIFRLVRLNSDYSIDNTFSTGLGPNSIVFSSELLADNKILIAGGFTSYNGILSSRIARVNSDGTLDGTFNVGVGPNSSVLKIAAQPDGKIIAVGYFTQFNGIDAGRVVRLNSDGTIDPSFNVGTGADNIISSVSVQPDGKIILAGYFLNFNGKKVNRLVRLNSDGSIDSSFNVGGTAANKVIWTTVLTSSADELYIGGSFTYFNGRARGRIARLRLVTTPKVMEISQSSCNCISYNNSVYTETGYYTQRFTDDFGDENIVNLNLTIFNPDSTIYQVGNMIVSNANGTKYQWFDSDNNQSIEGANNQTFIPSKSGNYWVLVSQNECKKFSSSFSFVQSSSVVGSSVVVNTYPNPFTEKLFIDLSNSDSNTLVEVFDMNGKLVFIDNYNAESHIEIGLDNLSSGIYLLKVNTNGSTFKQKIVKN